MAILLTSVTTLKNRVTVLATAEGAHFAHDITFKLLPTVAQCLY